MHTSVVEKPVGPTVKVDVLAILGYVVPAHAMKTYVGRRGRTPLILNLGTKWT